jgi:hypothetical protein
MIVVFTLVYVAVLVLLIKLKVIPLNVNLHPKVHH